MQEIRRACEFRRSLVGQSAPKVKKGGQLRQSLGVFAAYDAESKT